MQLHTDTEVEKIFLCEKKRNTLLTKKKVRPGKFLGVKDWAKLTRHHKKRTDLLKIISHLDKLTYNLCKAFISQIIIFRRNISLTGVQPISTNTYLAKDID